MICASLPHLMAPPVHASQPNAEMPCGQDAIMGMDQATPISMVPLLPSFTSYNVLGLVAWVSPIERIRRVKPGHGLVPEGFDQYRWVCLRDEGSSSLLPVRLKPAANPRVFRCVTPGDLLHLSNLNNLYPDSLERCAGGPSFFAVCTEWTQATAIGSLETARRFNVRWCLMLGGGGNVCVSAITSAAFEHEPPLWLFDSTF